MLELNEYLKVATAACGAMVLTFASLVAVSQSVVTTTTTGFAYVQTADDRASV